MSLQYSDAKVEVIDNVKMMSPPAFSNHNRVKDNVFSIFKGYLRNNVCVPVGDGQKVVLPSQKRGNYVVPDFFVFCDRSKYKADGLHGSPDLVVEVLSPKTAKLDRGRKKDLYQQNDVKEYWIIEPDKKEIEVYLLKDGVYDLDNIYRISDPETDDDPEGAVMSFSVSTFPDLVVNLEEIFEYVNLWEQQ